MQSLLGPGLVPTGMAAGFIGGVAMDGQNGKSTIIEPLSALLGYIRFDAKRDEAVTRVGNITRGALTAVTSMWLLTLVNPKVPKGK